jgi:hypothetical protein
MVITKILLILLICQTLSICQANAIGDPDADIFIGMMSIGFPVVGIVIGTQMKYQLFEHYFWMCFGLDIILVIIFVHLFAYDAHKRYSTQLDEQTEQTTCCRRL